MKQIVIASGKGGTGKTTLTALFAHLAAGGTPPGVVAVADADVEASNLPLALRVEDVECERFSGGLEARIEAEACDRCGRCVEVCRFQAVKWDDAGPPSIDHWLCEGCGFCAQRCPTGAVVLERGWAGTSCLGTGTLGPVAFGRLGPGQDLSGKLVTEVRRRAVAAAEAAGAELVLIDGPPGVGCPVISALAQTDLLLAVIEPTVSGVHDLSRLVDLARNFRLPLGVVLNKADLAPGGARDVRRFCAGDGLTLLGEIPFDPRFPVLLTEMAASGDGNVLRLPGTPAFRAAEGVWREAVRLLGRVETSRG